MALKRGDKAPEILGVDQTGKERRIRTETKGRWPITPAVS